MLSEPIRGVLNDKHNIFASPDTSVSSAAKLMAKSKGTAVMVIDKKQLVGIFTESDAVFRVIAQDRDTKTTRLVDVMTKAPKTITPDEAYGFALLMMNENGFRHVPVVENGEPIGIVSMRNALDPELEEFEAEAARREYILRRRLAP